jgi:hypothetical protein
MTRKKDRTTSLLFIQIRDGKMRLRIRNPALWTSISQAQHFLFRDQRCGTETGTVKKKLRFHNAGNLHLFLYHSRMADFYHPLPSVTTGRREAETISNNKMGHPCLGPGEKEDQGGLTPAGRLLGLARIVHHAHGWLQFFPQHNIPLVFRVRDILIRTRIRTTGYCGYGSCSFLQ